MGKVWSGNLRVTRVEIADPSGAGAAWDRNDGNGRPVRPGLYLVRMGDGRKSVFRKILVR